MNEILLFDSNSRELRFDGHLIVSDESVETFDDGCLRKLLFKVYAVNGGGFVAVVEYQANVKGETPFLYFEEVDTVKDVENFFYVFEVSEFLPSPATLVGDDAVRAKRTLKQLTKVYESTAFRCLDELTRYTNKHRSPDRDTKSESKSRSWFSKK